MVKAAGVRLTVISLVAAVVATTASLHTADDESRSKIASYLGNRPCQLREQSILAFETYHPAFYDLQPVCYRGSLGSLVGESIIHNGPHGDYRVVVLQTRKFDSPDFIVYVAGGPRQFTIGLRHVGADEEPYPLLPLALARETSSNLIVPDYLGTAMRSLYPGTDLGAAADEIIALIQRVKQSVPNARVVVVGASAGSLVAMEVLSRIRVPTVLVSPSPTSLSELLMSPTGTDIPINAAEMLVSFYAYTSAGERRRVTATNLDQFSAFAGEDFLKDLPQLIWEIPAGNRHCLGIVHGDRDRRVKIELLQSVRDRFSHVPILTLTGVGHEPVTTAQARDMSRAVEDVAAQICPLL